MSESNLKQVHKKRGSDEWFTPRKAVEDLLPFIPKQFKRVACPFDSKESEFVKVLTAKGYEVTNADLLHDNKDAFNDWDYSQYDIVITNPPFSRRGDVIKMFIEKKIPFILLLNLDGILEAKERYYLLNENENYLNVLLPRRNVRYIRDGVATKNCPFYSAWLCYRVFPHVYNQMIFMCNE